VVEVTAREADGIRAETRGEEGGNASTLSATSTVRLSPAGAGTRVDYTSDVAVTGRLGRFALGMMKKQAQNFGDAFAANLQARLAQEQVPASAEPGASAAGVATTTPAAAGPRASTPVVREVAPITSHNAFVRWLRRLFGLDRAAPRTPH